MKKIAMLLFLLVGSLNAAVIGFKGGEVKGAVYAENGYKFTLGAKNQGWFDLGRKRLKFKNGLKRFVALEQVNGASFTLNSFEFQSVTKDGDIYLEVKVFTEGVKEPITLEPVHVLNSKRGRTKWTQVFKNVVKVEFRATSEGTGNAAIFNINVTP
ncbi:MAG: hypothetical protein HRT88_15270 [Lentisphaeraceae bacterium]|nr:hypothetical protein [Lentisphaeraceae bacterium]